MYVCQKHLCGSGPISKARGTLRSSFVLQIFDSVYPAGAAIKRAMNTAIAAHLHARQQQKNLQGTGLGDSVKIPTESESESESESGLPATESESESESESTALQVVLACTWGVWLDAHQPATH